MCNNVECPFPVSCQCSSTLLPLEGELLLQLSKSVTGKQCLHFLVMASGQALKLQATLQHQLQNSTTPTTKAVHIVF